MKPFKLNTAFHHKVWGSQDLEPWFPRADKAIGEVWFTADRPLPILVKMLFTAEKLSVQVHPSGPSGKTEMWHILRAAPGASIALGLRAPMTRQQLREAALSGEIESLLNWVPVRAGETYFAPAGTVHAIGAGIALCEIQQNCEITYRLYDYGRRRELHVDQAVAVADLEPHPGVSIPLQRSANCRLLAECPYFATESLELPGAADYPPPASDCHLLICLRGKGAIAGQRFRPAEVWMVPRDTDPFTIAPDDSAHFLRTFVP